MKRELTSEEIVEYIKKNYDPKTKGELGLMYLMFQVSQRIPRINKNSKDEVIYKKGGINDYNKHD